MLVLHEFWLSVLSDIDFQFDFDFKIWGVATNELQ